MLGSKVIRDTWVGGRNSSLVNAAVTVVCTVQAVNNVPLSDVDYLTLSLVVAAAPDNAAHDSTVDIYVQRAFVPNPDPVTDADWEDMYHFTQLTDSTSLAPLESVDLPVIGTTGADVVSSIGGPINQLAIPATTGKVGDFYDIIRIVEVCAGTDAGLASANYTITVTGCALDS